MSDWWLEPAQAVDKEAATQARQRQSQLTKPAGSLGRLEALAIQFAGLQGSPLPVIDKISIRVFAADHGIANAGVSAYPQTVTREMVRNFANGGAAINVLARLLDADLQVIDVGTANDPGELPAVASKRIAAGTASFIDQPAMQSTQLSQEQDLIQRALNSSPRLLSVRLTTTSSAATSHLIFCSVWVVLKLLH